MREGQSYVMSLVESGTDTVSSFALGMTINLLILPAYYNINMTLVESFGYTGIFVACSMVRRYLWRRFFNWLHVKGW